MSLFEPILHLIEDRRASSTKTQIFVLLRAIMAHPFPQPGSAIQVKSIVAGNKDGSMDEHTFIRPPDSDNHLVYNSALELLRVISLENMLKVFASLLKERQILFVSKVVDRLSDCVQAMSSLLYPFQWQGSLIPVLPASMLDFICAPTPFLLGAMSNMVDPVKGMHARGEIDAVIMFDLDRDKFITNPNVEADLASLPKLEFSRLQESLAKFRKDYKPLFKDGAKKKFPSEHLHIPFINFFASCIGHYQRAMYVNPSGTCTFDQKKFLSLPLPQSTMDDVVRAYPPFITEFVTNTQMFGMFVAERESKGFSKFAGPFDKRLHELGLTVNFDHLEPTPSDLAERRPERSNTAFSDTSQAGAKTNGSAASTRHCFQCKAALSEANAKFCKECGAKQPLPPICHSATCKLAMDPASLFCKHCGSKNNICPDSGCGFNNKPGAKFCTGCGKAFPGATDVFCPNAACKAPIKEGTRFCNQCGAKVGPAGPACAGCGEELGPDSRFCNKCGQKIDRPAQLDIAAADQASQDTTGASSTIVWRNTVNTGLTPRYGSGSSGNSRGPSRTSSSGSLVRSREASFQLGAAAGAAEGGNKPRAPSST
eukprot:g61029.t1